EQTRRLVEQLLHVAHRARQRGVYLVEHLGRQQRRADEVTHEVLVAARGRHPAGGRMRALEQAEPFELGELAADARGGQPEPRGGAEHLGADGALTRAVERHQRRENRALALARSGIFALQVSRKGGLRHGRANYDARATEVKSSARASSHASTSSATK